MIGADKTILVNVVKSCYYPMKMFALAERVLIVYDTEQIVDHAGRDRHAPLILTAFDQANACTGAPMKGA